LISEQLALLAGAGPYTADAIGGARITEHFTNPNITTSPDVINALAVLFPGEQIDLLNPPQITAEHLIRNSDGIRNLYRHLR